MWTESIRVNVSLCSSSSSCLSKITLGLSSGHTRRCGLGIIVWEEDGALQQFLRRVTNELVGERGGEQGELQLVDGAGGEGLQLVGWGAGRGRGAGCHGCSSQRSTG